MTEFNDDTPAYLYLDALRNMAESCSGNTPKVARAKGGKFANKLKYMLVSTISTKRKYVNAFEEMSRALSCFRSNKISFSSGYVLISEINSITKLDTVYVLHLKSGEEVKLNTENGFSFIKYIAGEGQWFIL